MDTSPMPMSSSSTAQCEKVATCHADDVWPNRTNIKVTGLQIEAKDWQRHLANVAKLGRGRLAIFREISRHLSVPTRRRWCSLITESVVTRLMCLRIITVKEASFLRILIKCQQPCSSFLRSDNSDTQCCRRLPPFLVLCPCERTSPAYWEWTVKLTVVQCNALHGGL